MKYILLLLTLFSVQSFAQVSFWKLPSDNSNQPLIAGLGEPYNYDILAVTTTSYSTSFRTAIPLTGNDKQRQYRHIMVFNPSTTKSVYVCIGDDVGCSRDWYKARPGQGFVDDFTFFGAGNLKTQIYYRIDSAGTADFDLRIW